MSDELVKTDFSYEDFTSGNVFRYLLGIKDRYDQAMAEQSMSKRAKEVGFKSFAKLYNLFKEKQRAANAPVIELINGVTEFTGQEIELSIGSWHADDTGVYKVGQNGESIVACSHPIGPVKRMKSIDTGMFKYKLAYRRGNNFKKEWEFIDIAAEDMSNNTKIVDRLAPYGISVTAGDRAKLLVDYLREVSDANYDVIPETKSVSRMGWNEDGFSPYVGGVEFDGAEQFRATYKTICEHGTMEAWLEEARDARTYSTTAKIVLAASFAAPLMEPLGVLPFFVHLWSVESGTGKTVAQMLGASVWAFPKSGGGFFPNFKSTTVGFELIAGFLHSLPVYIDELQLAKDHHGNVRFNVYELAAGSGKLRGNKSLGLNYTPTWNTCFVTSGETPITKETDGEGAINRVFEIECHADGKVVKDGHRTANVVKDNYGHAGKLFITKLTDGDGELMERPNIQRARELYEKYYTDCMSNNTTEKQAMAAAVLLVADHLATEWIFQDGNQLTVETIGEFMKEKERVSLMDRGYDLICDWVAINANKLRGIKDDDKGECYGAVEDNTAYIIRSVFTRVCAENALNEKGMLSHLKSRKLIKTGKKGYTMSHYIGGGQSPNCVCLKLPQPVDTSGFEELPDTEEPPF